MSESTLEIIEHEKSTYTQHRVAIRISGLESMPLQEGTGRFQPEGIIIIFCRKNNCTWSLYSIEVYGPKLTKGGGRSSTIAKHIWWPPDEDKPLWVIGFIAKYYPLDLR
jgi:hypothetical protein